MVLGTSVVVSNVSGVRDDLADSVTGLGAPPGDTGGSATTLRWATDPGARQACDRKRREAQEVAIVPFSQDRSVRRLLDVVGSLPA